MIIDIEHNLKLQRFFTQVGDKEYSIEYNIIRSDLWEFHCPPINDPKEKFYRDKLLEYGLCYMRRNNIQLYNTGYCYDVSEILGKNYEYTPKLIP